MFDLMLQILALFIGLFVGYRRWIAPRADSLSRQGQGLLLLLVLTMVGGFIGSFGWWVDDPRTFSWDLPPLAGRMLASAAWAFTVAGLMALQKPAYERVRLLLWMLFVYLVPLALVIFLFHLDYFDFQAPIVYGFFIIVVTMITASSWYLYRQPEIVAKEKEVVSFCFAKSGVID
ncbi:MAG: hypothetical protein HN922_10440 [Anaerolineae bacterium]|nr:hypothetical protein [Anaerolineae bacterium]